jgi:hypothetical protein
MVVQNLQRAYMLRILLVEYEKPEHSDSLTLAHFKPWPRPITITLYSKDMFEMVHRSDQYINDSHQGRL